MDTDPQVSMNPPPKLFLAAIFAVLAGPLLLTFVLVWFCFESDEALPGRTRMEEQREASRNAGHHARDAGVGGQRATGMTNHPSQQSS